MKPILYTETETSYSDNGLGILTDAISCKVTQERNGSYELEMEYPVQGIHYSDITLQRIILATPDELSRNQPFRIYDISKPMSGTVTVYARHIAYGLMGIPVKPFTSASAAEAMQGLTANAAVDCPYTFSTDKETVANMTVDVPTAIWSLLGGREGGILDVYGGEYEFNRFSVILHKERGKNRGVVIRYGKNLTDLKQDQSCANVYTGVYPYWKSTDGKLVQLTEKVLNAEGTYPVTRILPLDFSSEWETAPTEDQLRTRAQTYMTANQIGVPTVSLTVEFVQIGQIEQIAICDTVTVYFEQIGVSATAKVTKTVYDVLKEQYDSIDIGYAKQTYNQMIASYSRRVDRTASRRDLQRTSASISASTKAELSGYATKAELNGKLSLSGGTLTGNLTGKYLTGTWLQTTAATRLGSTPTKFPVLDASGWIYYRTADDLKTDLGIPSLSGYATQAYVTQQIQSAINETWEASY